MEVNTEIRSEEAVQDMGSVSYSAQEKASDLHSRSDAARESQIESIIKEIQMNTVEEMDGIYFSSPSIWRVPPELRNLDVEAFEPKVVSIGPLHHGKVRLLPGEKLKLELIRNHGHHTTSNLHKCASRIFESVDEARERYSENINFSEEEFVKILVVDGYFIILFLEIYSSTWDRYPKSFGMKVKDLMSDIMLLENQIPLFILCKIYEEIPFLTGGFQFKPGMNFFDFVRRSFPERQISPQMETASHLLDVQQILLGKKLKRHHESLWLPNPTTIGSLTDLLKAGIKLKKNSLPRLSKPFLSSSLHIYFSRGTLVISFLRLTTQTAQMLRNLMAFEHGRDGLVQHATIYCCFMRNIIQTVDDVAILRRSGMLQNRLGSDAKVFEFFHSLGMGANVSVGFHHLHYFALLQEVEKFCMIPRHRWRASFASKYMSSPWTFLSVLAAVLLLSLTATQTFFTVFPRK